MESTECQPQLPLQIPGHSNVEGNDRVDELANEATTARSSEACCLPDLLKSQLSGSKSAIKQTYSGSKNCPNVCLLCKDTCITQC